MGITLMQQLFSRAGAELLLLSGVQDPDCLSRELRATTEVLPNSATEY